MNRYLSLLSAFFKRAKRENLVDFNPCADMEKAEEQSRQRYLTPDEQARVMDVLVGDLGFLVTPLEIALNAGLRKEELLSIKAAHMNLTGLPIFEGGLEINPGWLLIPESKNGKARQIH